MARNSKPKPLNPRPETRNLKPETPNPKLETRKPKPETRKPKTETRNPKPENQKPRSASRTRRFLATDASDKDTDPAVNEPRRALFQVQEPSGVACNRGQNTNYFTEMCSGSEAGSYLRFIYVLYLSTLGLIVIKKHLKYRAGGRLESGSAGPKHLPLHARSESGPGSELATPRDVSGPDNYPQGCFAYAEKTDPATHIPKP